MTEPVPTKTDLEAYYAMPREVKRWELPQSKPTKRPEEMKVLALQASPRVGGNTDVLVDEALRGAKDAGAASIEKITLQKIKLNFCIGCCKCQEPGWENFCAQKGDDANDVFQKMADSDAIIIGFPLYIGRESAQLCTFFDRCYCLTQGWPPKNLKLPPGKRGMVIGTWGVPRVDIFYSVVEHVVNLIRMYGIESVEALSACNFVGLLHGLDENKKAIILRFPKELEKAYQAGKSLVTG